MFPRPSPPPTHVDVAMMAAHRARVDADHARNFHAAAVELERAENHGFVSGLQRGYDEAALVKRAEMDESFRLGFAEGARLGYVNGYMQGSGDCAAAVVAHENGTPEAAPRPFANLRTHIDLLTSAATPMPALPPPPRALMDPIAHEATLRAEASASLARATASRVGPFSIVDRIPSPRAVPYPRR